MGFLVYLLSNSFFNSFIKFFFSTRFTDYPIRCSFTCSKSIYYSAF